ERVIDEDDAMLLSRHAKAGDVGNVGQFAQAVAGQFRDGGTVPFGSALSAVIRRGDVAGVLASGDADDLACGGVQGDGGGGGGAEVKADERWHGGESLLAEDEVECPATANVWAGRTQVYQDVAIGTTSVFQGIGEDGK